MRTLLTSAAFLLVLLSGRLAAQEVPDVHGLNSRDASVALNEVLVTGSTIVILDLENLEADGTPKPGTPASNDFVQWQSLNPGTKVSGKVTVTLHAVRKRLVPDLETPSGQPVVSAGQVAYRAGRFQLGVANPSFPTDPTKDIPIDPASGFVGIVKPGSQRIAKGTRHPVGGVVGIGVEAPVTADYIIALVFLAGAVAGAVATAVLMKQKREAA